MFAEDAILELLGALESVGNRIYPDEAPEGAQRPFVVFERISTRVEHKLNGPAGVDHALIQITVTSEDRKQAMEISREIRLKLAGFLGLLPQCKVAVTGLAVESGYRNFTETRRDRSDKLDRLTSQDFSVTTSEAVK